MSLNSTVVNYSAGSKFFNGYISFIGVRDSLDKATCLLEKASFENRSSHSESKEIHFFSSCLSSICLYISRKISSIVDGILCFYSSSYKIRGLERQIEEERGNSIASSVGGAQIYKVDKEGTSFNLLRRARPIKQLVISGGGQKGIVLPFYLGALNERTHILKQIETLYGTSAGSVFSYLLASGVSCKKTISILEGVGDFDGFKESNSENLGIEFTNSWGLKGTRVIEIIENASNEEIVQYLKDNPIEGDSPLKARLEEEFKGGITFNDLRLLNKLNPVKFKHLSITATELGEAGIEDAVLKRFSSKSDDVDVLNLSVARTVRASMSLPKVFKDVVINGKTYVDGGLRTNIDIKGALSEEERSKESVFALVFSKGETVRNVLYGTPIEQEKAINLPFLKRLFASSLKEYNKSDYERVMELGVNIGEVPHGNLGTLPNPFQTSSDMKIARLEAELAGLEKGRLMADQAVMESYYSLEELVDNLTPEEKEHILRGDGTPIVTLHTPRDLDE